MPTAVEDIRAAVAAAGKPESPVSDVAVAKADEKPAEKPKKAKKPKPAPVEEPPELFKYRVQLLSFGNPEVEVEAADRLDAIEAYKKHCGILATPHKFKVEKVKPPVEGDDEGDDDE